MASTADFERKHLAALLADIGTAMLTTRTRDGYLVSRPVATRKGAPDDELWFLTSASSHKAAEIRAQPQVNIAYVDAAKNRFVSVSGRASVRRDRAKIDALWSAADKVFFPGGKDDPDVTLLRLRIETAEYWDGPGTLVGKVFGFLAAAITGDADRMGQNQTLRIDPGRGGTRVVAGNSRGAAGRVERARKPSGRKATRR